MGQQKNVIIGVEVEDDKNTPKNQKTEKSRIKQIKKSGLKESEQDSEVQEKNESQDESKPEAVKPRIGRAKKRSLKYKTKRQMFDKALYYSAGAAIKLVKSASLGKFGGSVELVLVLKPTKKNQYQQWEAELPHPYKNKNKIMLAPDKFGVARLGIGLLADTDEKISGNLQAIISSQPVSRIKVVYLSPTMGPSVKLKLK